MTTLENHIAEAVAACPQSNVIMAAGFEAGMQGGNGLLWQMPLGGNSFLLLSDADSDFGLSAPRGNWFVQWIDFDSEESFLPIGRRSAEKSWPLAKCLKWARRAARVKARKSWGGVQ